MSRSHDWRLFVSFLCVILLLYPWPALNAISRSTSNGPNLNLIVDPSAVTIKVGDRALVNLTTITSMAPGSTVCYSQEGFPSSGFNVTFLPTCFSLSQTKVMSVLIVEATPAAAPQNFTAAILATSGNQTVSAPLTITVVPAISPWIPWAGILLFFVVIGLALFVGPRRSKKRTNP